MPMENAYEMHPRIKAHLNAIWSPTHPGRLRLVAVLEINRVGMDLSVDYRAVPMCARTEGCAFCREVLDAQKAMGRRLVDLGLLSQIEVDKVRGLKPATPAAS